MNLTGRALSGHALSRKLKDNVGMTTIDLYFVEKPVSEFTVPPQYAVKLIEWTTSGKDDRPLVSKVCQSIEEFESEIGRLKGELDRILRAARDEHKKILKKPTAKL
jgi:hypothetical protein